MEKIRIFDCEIDKLKKKSLCDALNFDKRLKIAKINTEFLTRSLEDRKFRDTINSFDLKFADGVGVLWAAKYLSLRLPKTRYQLPKKIVAIWQMVYSGAAIIFYPKFVKDPLPEHIPGVEALNIMLESAQKHKVGVFFFGSPEDVVKRAVEAVKEKYPNLKVAGYLNGYDYQTNKSIDPVSIINATDAKLLIVSQGSPRQEYWIAENFDKLKHVMVAVGEGGTTDRIANPIKAAPKWLNKIGLEWLWRIFFNKSATIPVKKGEKRGNFHRFWNSVPAFIYEVVKYKLSRER